MFHVGDLVKVNIPNDQLSGQTGHVCRISEGKLWPVEVQFNLPGGVNFVWPFDEDELEMLNA